MFFGVFGLGGADGESGQRIEIVNKRDKKARAHVEVSIKENALDKGYMNYGFMERAIMQDLKMLSG